MFIFIWGWDGFVNVQTTPKNAKEIQVTAQKWEWFFKYPNGWRRQGAPRPGKRAGPAGDALRGRAPQLLCPGVPHQAGRDPVTATPRCGVRGQQGRELRLFCAEFCGDDHSAMKTVAVVHEPGGLRTVAVKGRGVRPRRAAKRRGPRRVLLQEPRLRRLSLGVDGSANKGPDPQGSVGQDRTDRQKAPFRSTKTTSASRSSSPTRWWSHGYGPIMPTFKGKLKDEHIDFIIEYIKSLK